MFSGLRGNFIRFQSLNLTKFKDDKAGNQRLIKNNSSDHFWSDLAARSSSRKKQHKWPSSRISFTIFWDFFMFLEIFLSPQVKRCSIITYKHGMYELPHELLNDNDSLVPSPPAKIKILLIPAKSSWKTEIKLFP